MIAVPSKRRDTVVYELYNKGKKVYIGITNDPERRRQEHKQDKEFDTMKIVTGKRTEESARKEEQRRIEMYEKKTGHKPKYNK